MLHVQPQDPGGLTPNSSHGRKDQTYGRTQPLSHEKTVSLSAIYYPQSGRNQHAPLRAFPPSLHLQAENPGPEESLKPRLNSALE